MFIIVNVIMTIWQGQHLGHWENQLSRKLRTTLRKMCSFSYRVFGLRKGRKDNLYTYLKHFPFSGWHVVISVGLVNVWTINHMIPNNSDPLMHFDLPPDLYMIVHQSA